ncbi:ABC transporter ATP-binding protein [Methylopila sp. Yamaguchi]|uniref:ABC transporter ATP-binding protein n=1 Tax=Methylopila sp. Yamaguchi TaxID=1437817 RepID=UPI000CA890B7|nr:ABC transporter ATP-binding protein [Methylopila sp. Yamaguchi]GBD47132.1 spermidine/putrescine ABC transporter ATPase [Methylopila sp. Yamaguchi]
MSLAEPPLLALDGVDKTYESGKKPALDRVSFQVARGEFFSILGPSGSGKTTLLRMIAGFETPDRGRVVMDGEPITHVPPFKRDVRTVFQSYALFPHLTVRGNVEYPLRMARMDRPQRAAKAVDALSLVDMADYADRLPHQLSGGQRQRVALARAIVCRPRILLLDEPLGALDLRLRQQMQHTLVSLQKDLGIAFVYVTHDQGEALSMSNRVAVMKEGRIAQLGTPEELYFEPASEFVAQFVGRSNLIPVTFQSDDDGPVAVIGGSRFPRLRSPKAGPARLALRFEAIRVAPVAAGAGDLPGVVEDVLFLGTNLEINVRCEGLNLIASVPAARTNGLSRGQPVSVTMDLSNARVFHG